MILEIPPFMISCFQKSPNLTKLYELFRITQHLMHYLIAIKQKISYHFKVREFRNVMFNIFL